MKKEKTKKIDSSDYSPLTKLQIDFSDLKKLIEKLFKKAEEDKEAWELNIRSEPSCYVLRGNIDGVNQTWTIEEDENDDLKMQERLLWEVIDFFNMRGTRYDKERITIVRKRGDKYMKPLHAKDIKGDV